MKYKKIFILLFLVMFLFAFSVSCFGYNLNINDFKSWNYIPEENGSSALSAYNSLVSKYPEYANSDDYYYFVYFAPGAKGYASYFIKKSSNNWLNSITLPSSLSQINGYYYFQIQFVSDSFNNVYALNNFKGNNFFQIALTSLDYNNLVADYDFITNFDKDITFVDNDGQTRYFYQANREPYIYNSVEELQNMNTTLNIVPRSIPTSSLYFKIFDNGGNEVVSTPLKDFLIEDNYHRIDPFSDLCYYSINWTDLPKFSLTKNNVYDFRIKYSLYNKDYNISRFINVLVDYTNSGGSTITPDDPDTPNYNEIIGNMGNQISGTIVDSNKETQNTIKEQTSAINNQTEEIKKQHETSKNIFQKIGELLSYICPWSENFFVYKLLELLFEGLKSFILPSSEFLGNFFTELSDWFEERLGFLWTPFDIVNEFLTRLNNDTLFVEPIVHIPDIYEPFTSSKLISAVDFNFNSLLTNDTLKTVHNVYLIIVDFVIYIGVMTLCYNTLVSVFRGSPDSITINDNTSLKTDITSNGIKYRRFINKKTGR